MPRAAKSKKGTASKGARISRIRFWKARGKAAIRKRYASKSKAEPAEAAPEVAAPEGTPVPAGAIAEHHMLNQEVVITSMQASIDQYGFTGTVIAVTMAFLFLFTSPAAL